MRPAPVVVGAVLVMLGVIWTLQGLGATWVPRSFMTSAPEWIAIGAATAALGVWLILRSRRPD